MEALNVSSTIVWSKARAAHIVRSLPHSKLSLQFKSESKTNVQSIPGTFKVEIFAIVNFRK
jgi:hypothetical protein